jgi:hypothetical protein
LPSCATPPYDTAQLLHALAVELSPRPLRAEVAGQALDDVTARVILKVSSCDRGAAHVTLQIWSADEELLLQRAVPLREVAAPARARTLALVITDALRPLLAENTALPSAGALAAGSSYATERSHAAQGSLAVEGPSPFEASRGGSQVDYLASESAFLADREPRAALGVEPLFQTDDPYREPLRLRVGAAARARLITQHSNLLLGFELNAHGALTRQCAWAVEVSYSAADTWAAGELSMSWWNAAVGWDLVAPGTFSFSLGPRVSVGYVSAKPTGDPSYGVESPQDTALGMLGVRASFSTRLSEMAALDMLLEAHHILPDPGRHSDELAALNGWVLGWGMGVALQP